jgi:hypothetical protein
VLLRWRYRATTTGANVIAQLGTSSDAVNRVLNPRRLLTGRSR